MHEMAHPARKPRVAGPPTCRLFPGQVAPVGHPLHAPDLDGAPATVVPVLEELRHELVALFGDRGLAAGLCEPGIGVAALLGRGRQRAHERNNLGAKPQRALQGQGREARQRPGPLAHPHAPTHARKKTHARAPAKHTSAHTHTQSKDVHAHTC